MFLEDLRLLSSCEWKSYVPIVEEQLKNELQTTKGFLRKLRSEFDDSRKREIDRLLGDFYNTGVSNLDERVNSFTTNILRINQDSQLSLQYDLIGTILNYPDLSEFPCLGDVQKVLLDSRTIDPLYHRIVAILFKVSNQTLSQSNKSNAGQAGEVFARAILNSVGLVAGEHYREQYQSQSGSDTDIAFPCVGDFEDSKLEVLVAVQMSTNDRARLTSSELKKGVVGYVITGNGLKASSKSLKDIGTQIVSSYLENNVRLVCYSPEIDSELGRIDSLVEQSPQREELFVRRKYFADFAISFEEFARRMSRYRLLS